MKTTACSTTVLFPHAFVLSYLSEKSFSNSPLKNTCLGASRPQQNCFRFNFPKVLICFPFQTSTKGNLFYTPNKSPESEVQIRDFEVILESGLRSMDHGLYDRMIRYWGFS